MPAKNPLSLLSLLAFLAVPSSGSAVLSYTPTRNLCPDDFELVRTAGASQAISPSESAFISSKQSTVLPGAWSAYLRNVENAGSQLPAYVSDILSGANGTAAYPTLAFTSSGGGYRAGTFGAGVLNGFDGRNASAAAAGTGGLLQSASYLAGLSGSSWLVTSLAQANFPSIPELLVGPPDAPEEAYGGWLTEFDIAAPGNDTVQNLEYYVQVVSETLGKLAAGYPLSFTDIWARILARHFVNGTNTENFFDGTLDHGAGILFSDIVNLPSFLDYTMPFPIIVADSLSQYGNLSNVTTGADDSDPVPLLNPLYEFNPYEFGSWDPSLASFTPMKYLGTENNSFCTTGFDQASFITGTSSNIFNTPNNITDLINPLLENISIALNDPAVLLIGEAPELALYPNPFYGVNPGVFIESNATILELVDGGEDGQGTPMIPLLAKGRNIDVIIAIDGGEDVFPNWEGENTLSVTQTRVNLLAPYYAFPPVPSSQAELVADDLNTKPAFFGCNSSTAAPLLVWFPSDATPLSLPAGTNPAFNTSVNQISYSAAELGVMLDQLFEVATQGNTADGTRDAQWPACVACAVVDRARDRLGVEREGVCEPCLARYCWS